MEEDIKPGLYITIDLVEVVEPENIRELSGYKVRYLDGSEGWLLENHFRGARGYRPLNAMTFGLALEALKAGKKVARKEWSRRYLRLNRKDISNMEYDPPRFPEDPVEIYEESWEPTTEDLLADDWNLLE